MARRRKKKEDGSCIGGLFIIGIIIAAADYFAKNIGIVIVVGVILIVAVICYSVYRFSQKRDLSLSSQKRDLPQINEAELRELRKQSADKKEQEELLKEVLSTLQLENIDSIIKKYDDVVKVSSSHTLNNYSDLRYLRENDASAVALEVIEKRVPIYNKIKTFLLNNEFENRQQYKYVKEKLTDYKKRAGSYNIKVIYITPAGNNRGEKLLHISASRINYVAEHPELLMTKEKQNRLLKQQAKEALNEKKRSFYDRVSETIDSANSAREVLIVNSLTKKLDGLIQAFSDDIPNDIQKIKAIDC